jgi:uncharacterized protein YneR
MTDITEKTPEEGISLQIIALGNDGVNWFVRGTTNADIARGLVKYHLEQTLPDDDNKEERIKNIDDFFDESHDAWYFFEIEEGVNALQYVDNDIDVEDLTFETFPGVRITDLAVTE